jgi:O-antigen biosynthesis protein
MSSTTRNPRLLFFAHETGWSGAPIQLFHLVQWLKERAWDLAVVVPKSGTPESGPISAELRRVGIETYPAVDLAAVPQMEELRFLCRQFDVVIANTLLMWASIQAAHQEGVATIWYIHENLVARELIAQIAEIQPTLALADLLVMPTRRTSALYAAFTQRPIEIVPYGIGPLSPDPKKGGDPSATTTFLLLGSYERRKGQDIFLEAIRQMPAAARDRSLFLLAGRRLDQEFHEKLTRQAASLPNVKMIEELTHENACAAIASADVLVCASRDETMPIALLEAMSLGKAIVSTDVGGITEWLCHERNALIVPADTSLALSSAMTRCEEDTELRYMLGRNALGTFRGNFSLDRLGERFAALIRRAMSMKSR